MATGEALYFTTWKEWANSYSYRKRRSELQITNILEQIHDILDAIHWGVLCHPRTVKSECSYRFPAEELSLMIIDVGQLGSIRHHISHTWSIIYHITNCHTSFIIIFHLSLQYLSLSLSSLLSLYKCELLDIRTYIHIHIYTYIHIHIHTYIYIYTHIHTSK